MTAECHICKQPLYEDDRYATHHARCIAKVRGQRDELLSALRELRINANRLCDRNLGGTYEDDCRRSLARADAALTRVFIEGDQG
jgi:hypothetical protein